MTEASYWKRAFQASARWPGSELSADLRAGKISQEEHCADEYIVDFRVIQAALKRAEEDAKLRGGWSK